MKTWIFEIAGNTAFVYGISAMTGAFVLHRQIRYDSNRKLSPSALHERFLGYLADEIRLAASVGSNASYRIRGLASDVQRVRRLLRQTLR